MSKKISIEDVQLRKQTKLKPMTSSENLLLAVYLKGLASRRVFMAFALNTDLPQ